MKLPQVLKVIALGAVLVVGLARAHADERADRAAIAETLTKLSAGASSTASAAKASDDRGARKKFAPAATDLGDDLAALARRAVKDVPLKAIAKDAAGIAKDAGALVELADEVEDKDLRKQLRASAQLLADGVASVRKSIDTAVASADKGGAVPAAAATRYTGRIFNNSDSCSWEENLKFVVSRDGQQVFTSQMVFPGKDFALVVEKGRYLVQFFDTSGKFLGQGNLDANREGWMFKSGCVNQD